jgi:hypothetical protein
MGGSLFLKASGGYFNGYRPGARDLGFRQMHEGIHRMHEWAKQLTSSVIVRLTGRSSIPETSVIYGEAAAYWVPGFAGRPAQEA